MMAKAKKMAARKAPFDGKQAAARVKTAAGKAPTSRALADFLGVKLDPVLQPKEAQRLRKALPGYGSVLDDAAEQLREDEDALNLADVTPAALAEAQATVKGLAAREAVVEAVYRSIYHQRLLADDNGVGMLQKIARRVNAVAEDDPEIRLRWKFLLDYLGSFHGSGRPPKSRAGAGSGTAGSEAG